jgi:hypothetical protein
MTKRIVVMACLTVVTTACSPMGYPVGTGFNSYGYRHIQPTYQAPGQLPVGRWDNVMMLPVGAIVQVLLVDGSRRAGTIVSATVDRLRIHDAGGDVELPSRDVMRVDRPAGPMGNAVQNGARGAAFGAGVVGVLGLISGRVPPARLFLAGGIIGAEQNIELNSLARGGASIVYLAPAVSSGWRPAAQYPPR